MRPRPRKVEPGPGKPKWWRRYRARNRSSWRMIQAVDGKPGAWELFPGCVTLPSASRTQPVFDGTSRQQEKIYTAPKGPQQPPENEVRTSINN